MLCEHGYTLHFDCPECDCPGCGEKQDRCICHELAEGRKLDERLDDPRHGQARHINRRAQ